MTMTYDALNRLSSVIETQVGVTSAGYATVGGGITGLSGPGTQRQMTASYADSDHPSRQTSGHLAPESLSDTYTASYTSYDRVRSISISGDNINFLYNADHRRVKSSRHSNFETKDVRYYLSDCYELQMTPTDTTELLYFGGTSSDAPMVMERVNGGTLTAYNIGRDHIGTVTHVFTAGGALVAEYSYDPWGRPRDPSTHALTLTLSAPEPRFHRGFAGHEWIAACALWNMNARLYDPAFGVFLSPDPYVQAPDFTQNLNRYCYCLGNPLKYTDPEGEFWNYIIGALIGGISNWIANGCEFTWEGLGYFGTGAAIGVLTSGAAAFTTTAFSACGVAAGALVGATTGAATGATTGFLSNGLNNLVSGNKFMDGAWDATRSGMISGAISGVFSGGIAGGKKALESGKNVWWGSEVKNGRTQWSFFSSEKPYASIDYDINTISNNVNDCAPASFTEINDYYGGGKSYQDMCDRLGYKDGDGVVTTPGKLKNLAGELFSTKDIKLSQLSNIDFATGLQRDNKIISVLFNYDSNVKHMDVIRSIRYYSTKTVIKFRIGSYTLNSLVNKTYWALSISGLKY